MIPPATRTWIRTRLQSWFAASARELPWRSSRDAYAIWVSEVMLQQTQVKTVIPYFNRFLTRFPSVYDLALADEQEVLRLWEGLGYYRRARALHRGAQIIVEQMSGQFPQTPESLGELPGLGRYTVNAILSQAFDHRLPIVEANSERLLCRLLGVTDDPKATATRHKLWETAEELLPTSHVGQFNQALMELGALICKPANPECDSCPLMAKCEAHRLGMVDQIPRKAAGKRFEEVAEVALVPRRQGSFLLCQRPADADRWPSLWEFPHAKVDSTNTHLAVGESLLASLGLQGAIGDAITTIRHGVTRFRITLSAYLAEIRSAKFQPGLYTQGVWLAPEELGNLPVSAPQRRLIKCLQAGWQGKLFQ